MLPAHDCQRLAQKCPLFCGARALGSVLLASTAARAEPVEILYEQAAGDTGADVGAWLLCGALALALIVITVLFLRLRQSSAQRQERLQQAEIRLQEAQRIANVGSWSRDFESGVTFWSEEARRMLELQGDDRSFHHYERLVHPDDVERVTEVIAAAYHQGGRYQCDHRLICSDGKEKYIRLSGQVYMGDGRVPVRETGTVQDISDRRQAERALQNAEQRLRTILDALPYPVVILERSPAYPVLYANCSTFEQFGLPPLSAPEELKSRQLWGENQARDAFLEQVLQEKNVRGVEVPMRRRDGGTVQAQLSGCCVEFSGTEAIVIAVLDMTERQQIQQELARLATTDALSGVLNRRCFLEAAARELKRAQRYHHPFTLLMLDIDHFKRINDSYGHAFGDSVIRRFADIARGCLREEDVVGRVGGEEFCAVLTASAQDGGYLVAERIRKRWQEEVFEHAGARFNFTVSIGVASLTSDGEGVVSVMQRSEAGLRAAKRAGRNCVIVYSGEQETAASHGNSGAAS